jgi:hypothetical protein
LLILQPVVTIDATELAMLISGISHSSTNRRKLLPRRLGRRWRGTSGSEDGVYKPTRLIFEKAM